METKLEELERKVRELEVMVEAIGSSVSGILEALTDSGKMKSLQRAMRGVIDKCKNTNTSLN